MKQILTDHNNALIHLIRLIFANGILIGIITPFQLKRPQNFSIISLALIIIIFYFTLPNLKYTLLFSLIFWLNNANLYYTQFKQRKLSEKKISFYLQLILPSLFSILIVAYNLKVFHSISKLTTTYLINLNLNLLFLGYFVISYPCGQLIRYLLHLIQPKSEEQTDKTGLWIGIFERIIILTFILLNQFESIGFLITGKSILRIAGKNEAKKSEYVLLGTVISFSLCLLIGLMLRLILRHTP